MKSSDIHDCIPVKVSQSRHKKKWQQQKMQGKKQEQCHHNTLGKNNQNLINIWGPISRTKRGPKKEKWDTTAQGTLQPNEYDRPLEGLSR
eukprot:13868529-Ditylum_brightwellii.AAC.1